MNLKVLMQGVCSAILSVSSAALLFTDCGLPLPPDDATAKGTAPLIDPDYTGVVLPVNIAPLNFTIRERGRRFFTDIRDSSGTHIRIASASPHLRIPPGQWRTLLDRNRGKPLYIDIAVQDDHNAWKRYATISVLVAQEGIDRYCVYRLTPPLYTVAGDMGIYERDLSTFRERPIWLNRMSGRNCMNCHTFKNNDPDYMVAHMREGRGSGTFIKQKGIVSKVNTATDLTKPAGFPAWHPDGAVIAFSINKVRQFFHETGRNREGIDLVSDIILYDAATGVISSSPDLSSPDYLETQPEWSPDGRYLYFCRAPQFYLDSTADSHEKIFYDLVRVPYAAETNSWGEIEPVLTHEQTRGSVAFPRISPDGRFLLFSLARYGTFTIFRPGGDICLLDLRSGVFRRLEVNSNEPESYPVWSSEGRWFVFSSKRIDGITARIYLSRLDTAGNASKPILLPQKGPRFYDSFLMTYNVPALITKPVPITPQHLVRVMLDNKHMRNAVMDPALRALKTNQQARPPAGATVTDLSAIKTSH